MSLGLLVPEEVPGLSLVGERDPQVVLFSASEVERRFYEFCLLNTHVFGAPPENQRWSMDWRGRDPLDPAWDPSANSFSYFAELQEHSDFFGCVRESGSLEALQVGRLLDDEFIAQHHFGETGMKAGDYYQVVILTALPAQGRGRARALLSALIDRATRLHCTRVWSRCRIGNTRSSNLLRRHGGFVKHCEMQVVIGSTISSRDILRRDL